MTADPDVTAAPDDSSSAGDFDARGVPYAAALATLPGAGPAALLQILRDWTPEEAWRRIQDGRLARPPTRVTPEEGQLDFQPLGAPGGRGSRPQPWPASGGEPTGASRYAPSWRNIAPRLDPPGWWARYAAAGIGVTWPGRVDYPSALANDPERPGVLFWRGQLGHLAHPCVAVVGTRRATPDGRSVAFELGRDLAAAGVCVVSGLALGIDGAAHAGALSLGTSPLAGAATGPAGVAASGVDVPYPRRHAELWDQVVDRGVLLSETPPGRPPHAWRFPARNRIIAGLASLVVVVESHAAGGSLITAEAAIARGIEVRVVPGPVHSSASAGSNQLLYDGPGPVRNARDVLDALGIFLAPRASPGRVGASTVRRQRRGLTGGGSPAPDAPSPAGGADSLTGAERSVLDAVAWQPTLLSQVVDRTGLPVGTASRALDLLEATGRLSREQHWWVRRADR